MKTIRKRTNVTKVLRVPLKLVFNMIGHVECFVSEKNGSFIMKNLFLSLTNHQTWSYNVENQFERILILQKYTDNKQFSTN